MAQLEEKIHQTGAPTDATVVTGMSIVRSGIPTLQSAEPLAVHSDDGKMVYEYAWATQLVADKTGAYTSGTVLCADGQVRKLTWLSKGPYAPERPVSAAVKVGTHTVSGYLTLEPAHKPGDLPALKFLVNTEGKYGRDLPTGTFRGRRQEDTAAAAK